MELASNGRLVVWAGISLLILSFLFSNTLIMIPAVVLFVFLLAEGVSFRRVVDVLEHSVTLRTSPKNLETVVGLPCTMETIIENHTDVDIRVVGFHRNLPSAIRQPVFNNELLLPAHGKQRVETVLELRSPGRYEIRETRLAVERRTGLFRQPLALPDHVTITAQPIIGDTNSLPGLGGLHDLASDPNRRGVGTDFAGIRPAHSMEDLHRIDWKATARTGKLMAREFYLEREPSIMLVIDVSALHRTADGSFAERLLGEVAGLMANTQLARNPIGLVLYDERAVISNIEAGAGLDNRERVLRTIIDETEHASATIRSVRGTSRPYASLAEETRTMERQLTRSSKTEPLGGLPASFAGALLPFYRKAMSGHLHGLRRKGVFKAFDMINNLREPVLVIAISNDTTSLDGLYEGARHASMSNHRVVIAIPGHPDKTRLTEWLSNSEQIGVRTVLCPPEQLWSAINAELLEMGRTRFRELPVKNLEIQTFKDSG